MEGRERQPRNLKTADLAQAGEHDRSELLKDQRHAEERAPRSENRNNQPIQALPPATPLVEEKVAQDFQTRWNTIQVSFVDEPRRAVEQADNLVAETMKRLADSFAKERTNLESQWDRGDQVSTEDLRQALQRYRSFFQRLLAA